MPLYFAWLLPPAGLRTPDLNNGGLTHTHTQSLGLIIASLETCFAFSFHSKCQTHSSQCASVCVYGHTLLSGSSPPLVPFLPDTTSCCVVFRAQRQSLLKNVVYECCRSQCICDAWQVSLYETPWVFPFLNKDLFIIFTSSALVFLSFWRQLSWSRLLLHFHCTGGILQWGFKAALGNFSTVKLWFQTQ